MCVCVCIHACFSPRAWLHMMVNVYFLFLSLSSFWFRSRDALVGLICLFCYFSLCDGGLLGDYWGIVGGGGELESPTVSRGKPSSRPFSIRVSCMLGPFGRRPCWILSGCERLIVRLQSIHFSAAFVHKNQGPCSGLMCCLNKNNVF